MTDEFVSRVSLPMDVPVELAPKPSTDPTIMTQQPTEAEPPLEVWQEVNGMPYTAKHFSVNAWNKDAEASINAIEGYIRGEIARKGLDPTIASYNEIMGQINSFLQLSPNTANNVRFQKVADYTKIFAKYCKIENQQRKLLEQASNLREIEYG